MLPPKRPQLNGCVERTNDTTRVEFWNRYDGDFTVKAANRALADYQRFQHQVRPHQALDFMTPDEYLQKNKDSLPSLTCAEPAHSLMARAKSMSAPNDSSTAST